MQGILMHGILMQGILMHGILMHGILMQWILFVEKRIKKLKTSKTVCRIYVKNKYSLARKEVGDKLI